MDDNDNDEIQETFIYVHEVANTATDRAIKC